MQPLLKSCCGLDVHKSMVMACIANGPLDKPPIFGVSSLNMIGALLEKDTLSADEIAEMAKGKLKRKVNQLVKALNGNVTAHHRFLLKQHLAHIDCLVEQIRETDEEIQRKLRPYEKEFKSIHSVTGIKEISAASVIAEIGVDMDM